MKLRTEAIERWITIEGDNPGEQAEFLVRPMNPKQLSSAVKQCEEVDWDKNQRFVEPNFYKFKIKKIDQTILDWKGVEDKDGVALPCTTVNKEIVYIYNVDLIDKVLAQADKMAEMQLKDEQDKEKN